MTRKNRTLSSVTLSSVTLSSVTLLSVALGAALLSAALFTGCDNDVIHAQASVYDLWLVGDAAAGWGDTAPIASEKMHITGGGASSFSWEGSLNKGYLKISADETPSWDGRWYLPPQDEVLNSTQVSPVAHTLVLSKNGDGGEDGAKWEISAAAKYHIDINLSTLQIICYSIGAYTGTGTTDTFTHMWILGSTLTAEAGDWFAKPAVAMTKAGSNWTWTGDLASGYVKFNGGNIAPTGWNDNERWFCPPADAEAGTNNPAAYGANNNYSWHIASPGNYTITLNPTAGTVTFVKNSGGISETFTNMWLLGDPLTTDGETTWFGKPAQAMEQSASNWTWTGELTSGYLKFNGGSTAPTAWTSNDKWFDLTATAAVTPGTPMYFNYGASGDGAFGIVSAGNYTITLNPAAGTVTFVLNSGIALNRLWMLGDPLTAASGNWFAKSAVELTKSDHTFTWSGHLDAGYIQFNGGDTAPTAWTSNSLWLHAAAENTVATGTVPFMLGASGHAWQITTASDFSITVNMNTSMVTFTPSTEQGPGGSSTWDPTEATQIWLVGSTLTGDSSNAWFGKPAIAMTPLGSGVFSWTGNMTSGDYFKFNGGDTAPAGASADVFWASNARWIQPSQGTAAVSGTYAFVTGASGAYSWSTVMTGTYTLQVNVNTREVTVTAPQEFTPTVVAKIWLIGNATGTSSEDSQAYTARSGYLMTNNAGVWTKTVSLIPGELLFGCGGASDSAIDWATKPWYLATAYQTAVTGEAQQVTYSAIGQGTRYAFKVTSAGTYDITLDTGNLTATIAKQGGGSSGGTTSDGDIYLVGGAVTPSHDINNPAANKMTSQGGGIYTWTGTLAVASNGVQFKTAEASGWNEGIWYVSPYPPPSVNGTVSSTVICRTGNGNQFNVTGAGTYTITLDTGGLTVSFVKQ